MSNIAIKVNQSPDVSNGNEVAIQNMPDGRVIGHVDARPRVQFRLQSAKVGMVSKERNAEFITKPIVIEQRSLMILNTMYKSMKERKKRPISSISCILTKAAFQHRLNFVDSHAKDNIAKNLQVPEIQKYYDNVSKVNEQESAEKIKSKSGGFRSHSEKLEPKSKVQFGEAIHRPTSSSKEKSQTRKDRITSSQSISKVDQNKVGIAAALLSV